MNQNKKLEKFLLSIIKGGIYMACLAPLIFSSKFIYPFVFVKTVYFQITVEVIFFLYIVACLFNKDIRPKITFLKVWVALFLGILVLTALLGIDRYQSFFSSIDRNDGIINLLHYGIFFVMVASVMREKKDWSNLLRFNIFLFLLQAIISLTQYFGIYLIYAQGDDRPLGSLGNPSYLASYLLMAFFFTLYVFSEEKKGPYKIIFGVSVVLEFFALMVTENRGAIYSFIVSLAVLMTWMLLKGTPAIKQRIKIFLLVCAAVLVGVFAMKNTPFIKDSPLNRIINFSLKNITIENRLISWKAGIFGIMEKPFLGWGWQNFYVVFNRYYDPKIIKDEGTFSWYDKAHNNIIDIAIGGGIPALISYLGIIVAAYFIVNSYVRKSSSHPFSYLFFGALLVGYFLQNFFLFDTINTFIIFFLFLAYLDSFTPSIQLHSWRFRPFFSHTPFLIVSGIACVMIITYINVISLRASFLVSKIALEKNISTKDVYGIYRKIFNITSHQNIIYREGLGIYVNEKLKNPPYSTELLELALFSKENLKKSLDTRPMRAWGHLILSETARLLGDFDLAHSSALKAQKLSPKRYNIYFALGKIKMSQGDKISGILYFQEALKYYPDFIGVHWNIAIAAIQSGLWDTAQKEIEYMAKHHARYLFEFDNTVSMASAYLEQKKYQEALWLYEKASQYHPQQASFLYKMAQVYQELGEKELMEKTLQKAKSLEGP